MFPYGDFPRAVGSFREPVAIPVTAPDEGSQVCVQFGRNWLPYVLGSLQQLLLQKTWIYSTPAELKAVQENVFDLIAMFGNAIDSGACLVEPMFQQPDECTLQVSLDGGATWATIFSAYPCAIGAADNQIAEGIDSGILGGSAQPGPATPPIPAACWNYHVTLQGNGQWLLPFPVDDDWTITVSNATGGTFDGSLLGWACPEGTQYFLGGCLAAIPAEMGDPLPSANHQRLIARLGSATYVDVYDTTYTVPTGTGSVDVAFQVNDGTLSDNAGTYDFDLEVCNSTPAGCPDGSTWQSFIDFRAGLSGWTVVLGSQDSSGIAGQFLDGNSKTVLEVSLDTDACEVTRVTWTATRPSGSGGNDVDEMFITGTDTAPFAVHSNATGSPVTVTRDGDGTNCTHFDMSCNLGNTSDTSLRLLTLKICGKGTKPSQLP